MREEGVKAKCGIREILCLAATTEMLPSLPTDTGTQWRPPRYRSKDPRQPSLLTGDARAILCLYMSDVRNAACPNNVKFLIYCAVCIISFISQILCTLKSLPYLKSLCALPYSRNAHSCDLDQMHCYIWVAERGCDEGDIVL